jgi:hypothetical protein
MAALAFFIMNWWYLLGIQSIRVYQRDYWIESRIKSFSLRRFAALSKIMQADYQPWSPHDKTAQLQLYTNLLLLHGRYRTRIIPSNMILKSMRCGFKFILIWYFDQSNMVLRPFSHGN